MKKTIIGMVVGMMIMICVGFVGFTAISKQHETDIANLKSDMKHRLVNLIKRTLTLRNHMTIWKSRFTT